MSLISKLTKNCRCPDPVNCQHPYILADDGAGTIVKAGNKYIQGHKASILGFPAQGIPPDAAAVADAATFDGATFIRMSNHFLLISRKLKIILTGFYMTAPVMIRN